MLILQVYLYQAGTAVCPERKLGTKASAARLTRIGCALDSPQLRNFNQGCYKMRSLNDALYCLAKTPHMERI